jgi:hypothetical protein
MSFRMGSTGTYLITPGWTPHVDAKCTRRENLQAATSRYNPTPHKLHT